MFKPPYIQAIDSGEASPQEVMAAIEMKHNPILIDLNEARIMDATHRHPAIPTRGFSQPSDAEGDADKPLGTASGNLVGLADCGLRHPGYPNDSDSEIHEPATSSQLLARFRGIPHRISHGEYIPKAWIPCDPGSIRSRRC
jgi:hypothetical protein